MLESLSGDLHGGTGCEATGCRRELLFDSECDAECESEVCHWDNWRCFGTDEFELYDQVGNGSCQTRRKLRNSLV